MQMRSIRRTKSIVLFALLVTLLALFMAEGVMKANAEDFSWNLLTDTDLLIKEIAYACGFENEYYFSNFFKKHTTLSPSAFRASLT